MLPGRVAGGLAASFCVLGSLAQPSPIGLLVDFVGISSVTPSPFISLDPLAGLSPNITFAWTLPPGNSTQTSYSVVVTAADGTVAWKSGEVTSSTPLSRAPRSALLPATRYSWIVSIQATLTGAAWATSAPVTFFTSAPAASWKATQPIWAPTCEAHSPSAPAFSRFSAAPVIPRVYPGKGCAWGRL